MKVIVLVMMITIVCFFLYGSVITKKHLAVGSVQNSAISLDQCRGSVINWPPELINYELRIWILFRAVSQI
jgi:hypothetical protein